MNMDLFYKLGKIGIEDLCSQLRDVLSVYIENYNSTLLSITAKDKWNLIDWEGVIGEDGQEIPYDRNTAFKMLKESPELSKAYDRASDAMMRSVHNKALNQMIKHFEHYTQEFIRDMKLHRDLALKGGEERLDKSEE